MLITEMYIANCNIAIETVLGILLLTALLEYFDLFLIPLVGKSDLAKPEQPDHLLHPSSSRYTCLIC